MNLKGILLALSLALIMLTTSQAGVTSTEKILPSQVNGKTRFDLARTFGGLVFSPTQVLNARVKVTKSAKDLLNLNIIELKDGEIIYPEEISVFIDNSARPPHESPSFKPPHE